MNLAAKVRLIEGNAKYLQKKLGGVKRKLEGDRRS
jgi:hypothetical protein